MTDFSPKTRHADGRYATVLSRCKPCVARAARERRAADPEWAAAVNRRNWQRIKADPAKLAARRRLTRENLTAHRLRKRATAPPSEATLRDEAQKEAWRIERARNRAA